MLLFYLPDALASFELFECLIASTDVESLIEFEADCDISNDQLARAVHQRNRNMGDNGGPSSAARATKRPAESAPDAAALCAFAEHAFGLWRSRVPGEVLGRKVAALTMRMTAHGYNAPQLAGQMKEELQLSINLGDVMDLVVAWEDVNGVEYDPGQKMFKQAQTAATTATSGLKVKQESSEWLEMKTRMESLERELAQAHAGRETSSRRVPWGDRPLTEETIDAFLCEEEGVPEWMQEALDLVKMAISDMGEDSVSAVPAVDLWRLVTRCQHKYTKKYKRARYGGGEKGRGKEKSGRRKSSPKGKGKKHKKSRRRSHTSTSGSSSGSSSGPEYFWRGKHKFIVRNGVEFYVASNGREWRNDRPPPGDCDICGGRHWEWNCRRK